MNKIKLVKWLKLDKETLSKLQESQMSAVKGGKVFSSSGPNCTCRNMTCKGDSDWDREKEKLQ